MCTEKKNLDQKSMMGKPKGLKEEVSREEERRSFMDDRMENKKAVTV